MCDGLAGRAPKLAERRQRHAPRSYPRFSRLVRVGVGALSGGWRGVVAATHGVLLLRGTLRESPGLVVSKVVQGKSLRDCAGHGPPPEALALLESEGPCFCHLGNVPDEGLFWTGQEVWESGAEDFEIAFQLFPVRRVVRVEPPQIAEEQETSRTVSIGSFSVQPKQRTQLLITYTTCFQDVSCGSREI